jgi:hypothetical protein
VTVLLDLCLQFARAAVHMVELLLMQLLVLLLRLLLLLLKRVLMVQCKRLSQ